MSTMPFDLQRFSTYGSSRNDTISHAENQSYVYAYAGNDSIYNSGNRVIIYAGEGKDTVNNYIGDSVTIDGGAGSDRLCNDTGYYVSISGGAGNDSISNFMGYYATLDGGAGSDVISLSGGHAHFVTVIGGAGDDSIYANAKSKTIYQYNLGDGNDKIYNWDSSDTISFGKNVYYTRSTVGNDVVLSMVNGSGAVTLIGAANKKINILNGTLARITKNFTPRTSISGSVYEDTINNFASYVTIRALGGNDSIYNSTSSDYTVDGTRGHVTIDAGDGSDTITNKDSNVSINAGDGNDLISISGGSFSGITIRGGRGNDTLYGNGNVKSGGILYQFAYGDGFDVIYNWNAKDTISFGNGCYYDFATLKNDVVINTALGDTITLKSASKKKVNIVGGIHYKAIPVGRESLSNSTANILLDGSLGKDILKNSAGNVTISGNAGNDSIYSSTEQSHTVNGSYGYVTIDGGNGSDTIHSNDPFVSIAGGYGNDVISLSGDNWEGITVNGGAGNDTIRTSIFRQSGIVYQFQTGDGKDFISNWSDKDSLALDNEIYAQMLSGDNVLISLLSGDRITLGGANDKAVHVTGGTLISNDNRKFITNYTENATLNGSAFSDTITNYAGGTKIDALDGNDYIYSGTEQSLTVNGSFGHVTIDGGAGKDTIKIYDPFVSISGGKGDDVISLQSSGFGNVTVNGGAGNDIIYGDSMSGGVLYQYASGDGKDKIIGYDSKDTISLGGGNDWTTLHSGNNVLVSVEGSGTITLINAFDKTINVCSDATSSFSDELDYATSTVTGQDVIKKFMKSLDKTEYSGVAALNQAIHTATGGYFQDINAAINQMLADCRSYKIADAQNGWRNFLLEKCGINLYNSDTGAITGFDAGGSSDKKNGSAIVPESGNVHSFTDNSFTINGLKVQLAAFDSNNNPHAISYKNLSNDREKYIWRAFETWWASGALELIAQSYGDSYSFDSEAAVKKLYFGFYDKNNNVLADTYSWYNDSSRKTPTKLAIRVNIHNYKSLVIGDVDGKKNSMNAYYLDRVLAHEFTHAVMNANVNYVRDLPRYIREGLAELTHGIDDYRESTIISLAKNPDELSNALDFNSSGAGAYAGGYMFLRYLAKQGAEHYPTSDISGELFYALQNKTAATTSDNSDAVSVKGAVLTLAKDFSDDTLNLNDYAAVKKINATKISRDIIIVGNQKADSIVAGSGNDTIFANVGNDTLSGGGGNDILNGEAGNDKLRGGAGNDSLNGGSGNDTLTGGAGDDVFIFGEDFGKDVITDYTSGSDKIFFAAENASITSAKISGKNIVLTVDKTNTITVTDGKGKKITVVDTSGAKKNLIYDDLTLTNKSSAKVTLGTSIYNVDASARTKAVKITGNKFANSIVGGSGNDTFKGGKGNDTLWGNAGADTFIYSSGDGKDVIYGFGDDDLLKITGTFSTTYDSTAGEVYFKVGSTAKAITLRDFTATTFNVNGSKLKV